MAETDELTAAIEAGDRARAAQKAADALAVGLAPQAVLDAMTAAMGTVGARFSAGEIFVPEMLVAARAMKEALLVLEPSLVGAGVTPVATAVIGTVEGDLHDIGKNLVAMMWKGANIEVIDLGVNVPPQAFVDAVSSYRPAIVGLSALLTTTMPMMGTTIEAIRAAGSNVRVVVGGAPITAEYAAQIGADGFAPDAGSAARLAMEFIEVVA
jgi:5-methyltetrahydrofolate--homocysteine methyltransferase